MTSRRADDIDRFCGRTGAGSRLIAISPRFITGKTASRGPINGKQVVPSSWQNRLRSGPFHLAADTGESTPGHVLKLDMWMRRIAVDIA
jgi:hypothetical protein